MELVGLTGGAAPKDWRKGRSSTNKLILFDLIGQSIRGLVKFWAVSELQKPVMKP